MDFFFGLGEVRGPPELFFCVTGTAAGAFPDTFVFEEGVRGVFARGDGFEDFAAFFDAVARPELVFGAPRLDTVTFAAALVFVLAFFAMIHAFSGEHRLLRDDTLEKVTD